MAPRDDACLIELVDECEHELEALRKSAPREWVAIHHAISVLETRAGHVEHPWSSAIRGPDGTGLRELRPRAGRSRWRVLYRRHANTILLLALAPEAGVDRRGFARAVIAAGERFECIRRKREIRGNR